ncbi:MAG: TlpA family protein disulfide reductase [Niabella sp.]|nr:TlpA family protein disulfide reductase [Niabella sp.]
MKHPFLLIFLLGQLFHARAQESVIVARFQNMNVKQIDVLNNDYSNPGVLFKRRYWSASLREGEVVQRFSLVKPTFIIFDYEDAAVKKSFRYQFLLSPGDSLLFTTNRQGADYSIAVTGRGSENNQPLIQEIYNMPDLKLYARDSLPERVLQAISKQNDNNKILAQTYINKNKPTPAFVDLLQLHNRYFPVWEFISFKGEQKFSAGEAFRRNQAAWQTEEDALVAANPLNDLRVLNIPDFVYFLPMYVIRKKELLWEESNQNPTSFYKNWYNTNQKEGEKLFQSDMENDLRERIINKYFHEQTAEFLYGALFKSTMDEKQENVLKIFDHFQKQFPNSGYLPYLKPYIEAVKAKEALPLTTEMVLIENQDSVKTFDDLLRLVKGKAVLLDMWGTWCSPCRKEIQENSGPLKEYFKDKELRFVYVANYDQLNTEKWEKLIPYYGLTGLHILANPHLTKDIMDRVKGTGFPTYVVIKPDGSYELARSKYPMKRSVLIKQLEEAISSK